MAINFEIETRRVKVGKNGHFDVRAINADDFTYATSYFLDDLKAIAIEQAGKPIPPGEVAGVLLNIAKSFPSLIAELIARCAEASTEEEFEKFRKLPLPISIVALKEIVELTTQDGGIELGNVLTLVANQLDAAGLSSGPLMKSLSDIMSVAGKTSPS